MASSGHSLQRIWSIDFTSIAALLLPAGRLRLAAYATLSMAVNEAGIHIETCHGNAVNAIAVC